jgi:hypothetical protein
MLMSEGLVTADEHPGHSLSSSTFYGRACRGGWRPVVAFQETDDQNIVFHFVIDWNCPSCDRLISQSQTCPHCGLRLLDVPVEMRQRAKRDKLGKYKGWFEEEVLRGVDDGVRNRDRGRLQDQPKADPEQRADTKATGRRREARATSRY